MDCRFVIDEETYIKWDLDKFATRAGDFVSTDVKQRQSNLDLRLLCFHTDRVQEILSSLKQDATLTDIAAVLSDLQQTWPPPQDYIVILNPDHASKQRIWISYKLRPTVQLENHLTIGENVLRIIQLTDLAQFTFVLYACERQTTELDEFLVRARRALRNEELPEDDRMDTVGDDDESHRKRPPIPSVAVTVRLDGY
ncbi:hypothetical protein FA15DRAFT_593881 [Coprinopsis marcescibilis]|uniref:Uncharacterized protein n=1 Tax=Coprinopsis marcescibilis TaxID=230819 RepID=A0A5C3KST9_COPMA|nr:hypothetical protein FA15DRAFT_593881 [Coprinopsis marcescibilis]